MVSQTWVQPPHVLISDATSHSQFAPPQYLHIANNLSNRSKRELDSLWPSYKIWHEVNTESCHDATFDITDVIMTTPSATSDVIVAIIITSTPYMVLPLFATRFAAYAGGIRVSFMHTRLFLIWYKMFCMRDISYRLAWMKFINMLSVFAQSGMHRGFNWWIIAVST